MLQTLKMYVGRHRTSKDKYLVKSAYKLQLFHVNVRHGDHPTFRFCQRNFNQKLTIVVKATVKSFDLFCDLQPTLALISSAFKVDTTFVGKGHQDNLCAFTACNGAGYTMHCLFSHFTVCSSSFMGYFHLHRYEKFLEFRIRILVLNY